jgi:tetratricopeptide (TPR) repeat protein
MLRIFHRFWLLVVLLFLISLKSFGQEKENLKSLFVEAESFFLFEEYKDALPLYQKILRMEPDNYNIGYKIGVCYLNDIYLKAKSIKYLKEASQHTDPAANTASYREKFAPLDALFYLGNAYRVNNMLDDAIESYQHFKGLANPQIFDIELVNTEIATCQRAKKLISNPIYFVKKNITGGINTRFAETNPVISGDGKFLVFNRELQFYNGVFISTKDNLGNWSEPVNLTPDFGLDGNSLVTGVSNHGDEIFVYRSDQYDGNIYSSKLVNDKWSKLVKLNDNINTKFWESHASPSPDGNYLYFTSNRPGGYGGLDIYKSKRGSDGEWGIPVNLGPVINSPENEETPFLSNDGYTLFFSSLGHETIGGYDIFMSTLQSDGTWGKPKNMGYPLCTTDDDLFYCPAGSNSNGFYSIYDASTTQGLSDIYSIEVYNELIPRTFTLSGKVNLEGSDSKAYKKVSVKVINPVTHQLIAETNLEKDGSYKLKVNQGKYTLVIGGGDFQPYTNDLDVSLIQPDSNIALQEVKLTLAAAGVVIPIVVPQVSRSQITAKHDFYTVNDPSAISIELNIPKDSKLKIEIYNGSDLVSVDSLQTVGKHFAYIYKPKPGENLLRFTATDPDGNISTTEVHVTYIPPVVPVELAISELDTSSKVPFTGVLMMLSTGKLYDYLSKLDSSSFEDSYQLYQNLLDNARQEGFTNVEVDRLFSIYYTQKNLDNFDLEFRKNVGYSDSIWDKVRKNSMIPLQYIKRLLALGYFSDDLMSNTLIKVISKPGDNAFGIVSELNAYSVVKSVIQQDKLAGLTSDQAFKIFEDSHGAENARNTLQLSSTTESLEYFYQNLLLVSSGNLKNYLDTMQMASKGINTSIDLVKDLFNMTGSHAFSPEDLIKTLDLINSNKSYYLSKFKELMASEATGDLKSQLQSIDLEKNNIRTYEDLLKYVLTQVQNKNYSKQSVYDVLLKLIGVKDVKEFADLIRSYQNQSINNALDDSSVNNLSTPMELLQYLLSSAQSYNYSESDINNLLIRMILEKGLENRNTEKFELVKHRLWKNPTFVNTIILVDIIIVLMIILIILRKKKNS